MFKRDPTLQANTGSSRLDSQLKPLLKSERDGANRCTTGAFASEVRLVEEHAARLGWVMEAYTTSGGAVSMHMRKLSDSELRALAAPGDEKACPMCAETVKAAALVCRFCGHLLADA